MRHFYCIFTPCLHGYVFLQRCGALCTWWASQWWGRMGGLGGWGLIEGPGLLISISFFTRLAATYGAASSEWQIAITACSEWQIAITAPVLTGPERGRDALQGRETDELAFGKMTEKREGNELNASFFPNLVQ